MNLIRNPYLLASVGAPLVVDVAAGGSDNVRRATGLVALASAAFWLGTQSDVARNVAMGAGGAWAVMKLGLL